MFIIYYPKTTKIEERQMRNFSSKLMDIWSVAEEGK